MGSLTGTGLLLRLDLRRDRVLGPAWVAVLVMMTVASAAATPSLYRTESDLVNAAKAINGSPAIVALYGPILDPTSKGEVAMTKMTVLYALFAAVFFVVLIRRHTRVEEESGRTELVGGTAVGRDAPLAAALLAALVWGVVLSVLVALGNIASGLPVVGSLAFSSMWFGVALVGIGVGAVTAQLSASARTCASWAAAVLGLLYVLRAAGDAAGDGGPSWLSWCTPFGWNTQFRAWSGTRWWLLAAYVAVGAVLVGVAVALRARRDLGSGLIAARPGPAHGARALASIPALTLKLQATPVVLWTVAMAAMGALFGAITPTLDDFLDTVDVQAVLDQLGGALIAAILSVMAILVGYFASAVFSHAARDEEGGQAELVLATGTSRSGWFWAPALVGLFGALWLLVVTGVGLWIGYAAAGGPDIGNLVLAAVAWAPAVWVVGALGLLSLALRPALAPLVWVWPAIFFVFTTVADLFEAPDWLLDISPYRHVPQLPADSWSWSGELGLTAVALVLVTAAWWRFCRRDIG